MAKSSKMTMVALELFVLACFCSIAPAATTAGPYQLREPEQPIIQRIDIRGNRRTPEETIRLYIQSRQGEPYDETRLGYDLRALYKANFFDNIEIQERDGDTGKIVTFILKEKPLIHSIEYSGNKSFKKSNILDAFKEKIGGDNRGQPVRFRKITCCGKSSEGINDPTWEAAGNRSSGNRKRPPRNRTTTLRF
jgi:outer membrane protein assembly factor BamA